VRALSELPDGPREFTERTAGMQAPLDQILREETNGDLCLGDATFYKYGDIHDALRKRDHRLFIRMWPSWGLHYVTLHRSEKWVRPRACDKIRFHWQDNGVYGTQDAGNPGLYTTEWRDVGENVFSWGAKRVVLAPAQITVPKTTQTIAVAVDTQHSLGTAHIVERTADGYVCRPRR
jgi:hypothetical protein